RRQTATGATDETRFPSSAGAAYGKGLLAKPRRVERYAGISPVVGAGISSGHSGTQRRRMVATRLPEIDGRVNGAGGDWPNELSPAGNASGSFYQERRMDYPRKIPLLRDRNAAAHGPH